jgi:flagellar protein FlaG
MEEIMATEISNQVFPSALSVYPLQQHAEAGFPHPSQPSDTAGRADTVDVALEKAKKIVAQMSEVTEALNRQLKFEVDLKNHDIIVKVIDPTTDKVIRELPPAELEKLHDSIREAVGHLINELI